MKWTSNVLRTVCHSCSSLPPSLSIFNRPSILYRYSANRVHTNNRIATTAVHTHIAHQSTATLFILLFHIACCGLCYCIAVCYYCVDETAVRRDTRPLPSYLSPLSFSLPLSCAHSFFLHVYKQNVHDIRSERILGWIANGRRVCLWVSKEIQI